MGALGGETLAHQVALALLGPALLALAVIDLRRLLLPDAIVVPVWLLGLLVAWAVAPLLPTGAVDPLAAVLGSLLGAGGFWLVRAAHHRLRRREGLGLGDVKLCGAAGAWVGWGGLGDVLLMGALATLALAFGTRWWRPRGWGDAVPFGPGLALGLYVGALGLPGPALLLDLWLFGGW